MAIGRVGFWTEVGLASIAETRGEYRKITRALRSSTRIGGTTDVSLPAVISAESNCPRLLRRSESYSRRAATAFKRHPRCHGLQCWEGGGSSQSSWIGNPANRSVRPYVLHAKSWMLAVAFIPWHQKTALLQR